MIRKLLVCVKCFGRHKNVMLVPLLVLLVLTLWPTCWWFAVQSSRALELPPPPDQPLQHFRRQRSLQFYMSHTQVLIEPSNSPCRPGREVQVIVLVSSAPARFDQRQAVRRTWARYQPTYFVLGLYGNEVDEKLVDNYLEAKQYGDVIIFGFRDHYQNLTLKTALMMQWTLDHCPQARFLFKTDDDVMVNPWTLAKVLKENVNTQLLGYRIDDTRLHREEYSKWYVPRWLRRDDNVSKYLSGTGYLINGKYIQKILTKAYQVPLVNLEDVYFTYLVAHQELGLTLTHDKRLSPSKPWLEISCLYWGLASIHSLSSEEMLSAWSKIEALVIESNNTDDICRYFTFVY